MPQISQKKRDKISEQILQYLFEQSPSAVFTNNIADSIARDEEFIKSILINLERKDLVVRVTKNQKGINFKRRQRWRLSNSVFEVFKGRQSNFL